MQLRQDVNSGTSTATIDTTEPGIITNSITLESNNTITTTRAKPGHEITLKSETNEPILTPSVTFTSGSVNINNTPSVPSNTPN